MTFDRPFPSAKDLGRMAGSTFSEKQPNELGNYSDGNEIVSSAIGSPEGDNDMEGSRIALRRNDMFESSVSPFRKG